MQLIFATNNAHKVKEINEVFHEAQLKDINVVTMKNMGFTEELPETTGTIAGNSLQKATYLHEKLEADCFSEDTGLEIDALNGEPGVDTAHYSGSRDADKNITLVLNKMKGVLNRTARFRTVITLILNNRTYVFEGICEGEIKKGKSSGNQGFGYDPIFQPTGYNRTFADLPPSVKNKISHRGKATELLIEFLKNISVNNS
jgi:XTP/dITP diphosphohydrolase